VFTEVEFDGLGANFCEDFIADFAAVEDARGHAEIIAWGRTRKSRANLVGASPNAKISSADGDAQARMPVLQPQ
jgi:hypothetical protein